ncbi:hypothetical protein HDV01_003281 [Terramyces sp. JEL0728]|nr:hypothetical protein HDV01_003281 [Terramyces sp. JEL0728]
MNPNPAPATNIFSLVKSIPLGTSALLSISTFFFIINIFSGWQFTEYLCLASTNTTNGILTHIFPILFNPLVHKGFYHQIIATILFPFVAANVESHLGTFQFLYLFLLGTTLVSIVYVAYVWIWSWIFTSWGYACIEGLDIPFFIFLSIESLNSTALLISKMGLAIPRDIYPFPFLIILFILMPFTTILGHLFACAVGYLYDLMLTTRAVNSLETSGLFAWFVNLSSFVPKPGDVQLPDPVQTNAPGSFPNQRLLNATGEPSFMTQVSNAFSRNKYIPINENQQEPLLWDETDEQMSVQYFISKSTNPFLNLAFEDWLFRHNPARHILFFYRNSQSIIIGRNQNPWKEINFSALRSHKVPLVRRNSGGGTDLGNTNYCHIMPRNIFERDLTVKIIRNALHQLDIPAEVNARYDLVINSEKISGSAYKLVNSRAYHHGTMLIDTDLKILNTFLNPKKKQLVGNGIESVRSIVTKLREFSYTVGHLDFCTSSINEFHKTYGDEFAPKVEYLDETNMNEIVKANLEKLKDINLKVRNGEIQEIEIASPDKRVNAEVQDALQGKYFDTLHSLKFDKESEIIKDSIIKSFVVGRKRNIWDDRRDEVVQSFRHAWNGYKASAWGFDELLPISKIGTNWFSMGCTIIDALDTALIMEQEDIYFDAKHWIETDLKFDGTGESNVFEITIRVLGGLLSTYTFTEEQLFLDKAVALADLLLIAFDSPSKIPFSSIDFSRRVAVPSPDVGASTSEATTLQMEFKYLTYLTKNPKYWNKAQEIMQVVFNLERPHGLVPVYISASIGKFVSNEVRLGSRGDSYYEYLGKQWLLVNETESKYIEEYRKSILGIREKLLYVSYPHHLFFVGETTLGTTNLSPKMDHLVCFLPGTMAWVASKGKRITMEGRKAMNPVDLRDLELAEELARSCYEMNAQTLTGLSPEIVHWRTKADSVVPQKPVDYDLATRLLYYHEKPYINSTIVSDKEKHAVPYDGETDSDTRFKDGFANRVNEEDFEIHDLDTHNLLRPETVESLFILYRVTGKSIYREWGYSIYKSFEKYCKNDVRIETPLFRDKMQTFFLGETLKYIYLLFSPDEYLPLDKFIFNTEAHPLPVFDLSGDPIYKDLLQV